jgi:hypothetical protein
VPCRDMSEDGFERLSGSLAHLRGAYEPFDDDNYSSIAGDIYVATGKGMKSALISDLLKRRSMLLRLYTKCTSNYGFE